MFFHDNIFLWMKADGLFSDGHVFLTVSSQAGVNDNDEFLNRMLEMNWNNLAPEANSWIGIFNYDPQESTENDHLENALSKVSPLVEGTGSFKSEVRFAEFDAQGRADNKGCVGYWITYFSEGNTPLTSNCLKIYPTWMNDLKDVIGDTPLTSIMIPGTHNAGAWHVYGGKPDDQNLVIKYLYK